MVAITGVIPNLVNGVSRQPEAVRLNSQLEEQINGWSSVVRGLQNRPGTKHVKTLTGTFTGDKLIHWINRDTTERYAVVLEDGDLKVFDQDGNAKTVAFPDGKTYLNITGTPKDVFSAATNADYTFIANKEVTPDMDATSATAAKPEEALVFFRAVNFARRYKLYINGTIVADWTTASGSSGGYAETAREEAAVTPVLAAKTMFWGTGSAAVTYPAWGTPDGSPDAEYEAGTSAGGIQATVHDRIVDNLDPADWAVTRHGSVLYIKNKNGTPFTVNLEVDSDAQNRQSVVVIQDEVRDFADLPPNGPKDYVVKIINTDKENEDDYYVKFTKDGNDDGNIEGIWKECPGPSTELAFDAATVPHVLVRETDGTFTFREATEWVDRRAGDIDLDPGPSFIGTPIQGVFFAKGRLAFLAGENVIMSRSNQFFDFWRLTMIKVLDDDPVDVAANDGPIADNSFGASWRRNVTLVSDQAVTVLSGGQLLTPQSAKLDLAFEENFLPRVKPARSTRTMFFAAASNSYGDVREVFIGDDPDNQTIGSIGDHVPNYINKDITEMVSSPKENCMFLRSDTEPSKLWVYQWFWQGQEKAQSAWHTWEFDSSAEILGMTMWNDDLYLMIRRGTTLYLEMTSVVAYLLEANGKWNIRLDRKDYQTAGSGTYDAGLDETTFTVPYTIDSNYIVVTYGGTDHGIPATINARTSTTIKVDGDWSAKDVVIGRMYTFEFTLNRQYFTISGNGSFKALERQRLQILRHIFEVNDTAYFAVEVTPYEGATARTVHYSSLRSGDAASALDTVNLLDNPIRVPINAKAERAVVRVYNDTHYPTAMNGIEWEGLYQERAKRVA